MGINNQLRRILVMRNNSTICITELLMNFNKAIAYLANSATKMNLDWEEKRSTNLVFRINPQENCLGKEKS
jgi:hypothetical protein